jgi:hypothetical protein
LLAGSDDKEVDEEGAISERYRRSMEPDARMHARDARWRGGENPSATKEDYAQRVSRTRTNALRTRMAHGVVQNNVRRSTGCAELPEHRFYHRCTHGHRAAMELIATTPSTLHSRKLTSVRHVLRRPIGIDPLYLTRLDTRRPCDTRKQCSCHSTGMCTQYDSMAYSVG